MNMRSILFVLPLCAGLLAGCDNKQESEATRTAAQKADDLFLELETFDLLSGDYGPDCDTFGVCVNPRNIGAEKAGEAAERLIELAESAPVDRINQALLMRAGDVLQEGKYVMQDSRRAAALYVKAWEAGDQEAASRLVAVYRFLKDSRRTYFWEVRSKDVQQLDSRDQLTGDEISAIQKIAADSSRTNL
ncbi:hypothetical protein NEX54_003861 [Escherichia coli]|uniref:hypothetical protein n=1 Tax=Klebsiella pneumoniae TaxID=573 RepID=UPI0029653AA1|nr:hypothetical protein [Klebsiella pneumoniae]EHG0245973.1 hypothetical protein [Salmonella enterica subsp. enterica serovar Newport]EJI4171221.1 hypothetical protein [Escherichia coli]MDW1324375.1 hypothetical protein [Klebsiella pneumoniae]